MKKLLALLLAIVMIFCMVACGSSDDDDDDDKKSSKKESSSKEEKEEKITFEETVIVDNDYLTFTINEIDPKGDWGYTLHITAENKSEKDMDIYLRDTYINDVGCNPVFYAELPAGESLKDEISFMDDELEACGVTSITKFEFTVYAFDPEDYVTEYAVEPYTIYPLGEDKAISQTREAGKDDIVLFDNQYGSMTIVDIDPDSFMGYAVTFYVENTTNQDYYCTFDTTWLNGEELNPWWGMDVAAGKRVYGTAYWYEEDLAELGIDLDAVTELKLAIELWDDDYDHIFEEEVVVNLSK